MELKHFHQTFRFVQGNENFYFLLDFFTLFITLKLFVPGGFLIAIQICFCTLKDISAKRRVAINEQIIATKDVEENIPTFPFH